MQMKSYKLKREEAAVTFVLKAVFTGILLMLPLTQLYAAPAKPVISRQPAGATCAKNATARFYVNAYSVDGGYLEYQWYRSGPFVAPEGDINVIKTTNVTAEGAAAVLNTTTPNVTGAQYYYYWVKITNIKEGESDFVESAPAPAKIVDRSLENSLMQGDFEDMIQGTSAPIGDYWNTTHDAGGEKKVIEIHTAVTYGSYSNYSGTNLVSELSPHATCSNYQDIATVPGKIYEWSLYHSARLNHGSDPQVMAVVIGPAVNMDSDYTNFGITKHWIDDPAAPPDYVYPYGKNYITYFYDIVDKLAQDLNTTVISLRTMSPGGAPYTTTYGGNTYYVYISSDTKDAYFVHRSGVYSVPAGQGTTVFGFVPITDDNAGGNLIDNVVFASGSPVAPSPTIAFDNAVSLSAPTKAGYVYGIAEVRGSSVSVVADAAAYYDPDGTGAAAEVAISRTAGLGIDGWYSTYGSNTPFVDNGVITFRNLTPGKTYRIVGIPLLAVNDDLHVNESPEYVLDEGYYTDVKAPSAYEGDNTTVWNIEVETYPDGATQRARIAVKNARTDTEYALLAGNSSSPVTSQPAHANTDWTPGTPSGYATFDALALDAYYYLVVRPDGYDEVTYAAAAADADGSTPRYIRIKTPGTVVDIDKNDVARNSSSCLSIGLKNSKTGYTYAVVDPETGAIIGNTQSGSGSELSFTVPDPSKAYRIVTKSGDVNWMKGVRVYGCPDVFSTDYRNETVRSSHDASGNIPVNVEYRIRSNNSGSTWIVGSASTWTAGIGTQPVDLATKILAGNTVGILDSITSLAAGATLYYRIRAGLDGYTGESVSPVKNIVIPQRPAAPAAPGDYAFNYVDEQINVTADSLHFAQINASQWTPRLGGFWTFAEAGWGEGTSPRPFHVRFPATDTRFASVVRTDTVPARPAAPDVDLVINSSISKIVVTGLTTGSTYQYHVNAGTAWQSLPTHPTVGGSSDSIAFSSADTCYVRYEATATAPASHITALTATPLSILPVYFTNYAYGATPVQATVTVRNRLNVPVTVTSLTLEGANAGYYTLQHSGSATVPANGTNTDWKLTPNNGLGAGTYNTQLKVTDGTYTAYADVYLTVDKANWNMSGITGSFDVSQTKAQRLVLDITGAPAGAVLSYWYGSTQAPGNPASTVNSGGAASYTFTGANGLLPSSTYQVSVIAQEDGNHNASSLTVIATGYTAYATPVFDDVVTVNYISESLIPAPGYSFTDYTIRCTSCSGSPVIASPYSLSGILEDASNSSIVFSIVRNAGASPPYPASEAGYSGTVPGRPAAPAIDAVTHATSATSYDGAITVSGLFGYRIHGASTWSAASNSASSLGVGDYDVRYPATATVFASHWVMVTVSTIVTQPASVEVEQCCIYDTLSVVIPSTANTVGYQWYDRNGNEVAGADSCCFPVPAGLVPGEYDYCCKITFAGSDTLVSDMARVRVTALSGRIASVSPSVLCIGGDITLTFSGTPPYEVYYTVDGAAGEFFTVTTGTDTTIVTGTVGVYTFTGVSKGHACPCAGNFTVEVKPALPDVSPVAGSIAASASGGNPVTVTVDVSNSGTVAIASPVSVTLYEDSVTGSIIGTGSINESVGSGDTKQISVTIADITQHPVINIAARVNDDGTTFPFHAECDTANNVLLLPNTLLSLNMTKDATLRNARDGIFFPHNGWYANPVSVLYGDTIEYKIKTVNPVTGTVIIRDTLPFYLKYAATVLTSRPASQAHGTSSSESVRDTLSWTLSGITAGTSDSVIFRVTPASGANASQPLYVNRAWVEMITDTKTYFIPTGNRTYHQGAGTSVVTFSAGRGGSINNADPQAVDYSTTARAGVLVAADSGYTFAGWRHDAYTSYRGRQVAARSGIRHYDTLAIYGDVELRAVFALNHYPIRYYLNGAENDSVNPSAYTVESAAITLAAPVKPGDVFTGWTGSNGEAPQETVTIPAGSTGDRTYYANFLYSGREAGAEEETTDKIWSFGDEAYIRTYHVGNIVRIYTPDGFLRRQHTILTAGTTKLRLAPGIYIVTLNNGAGEKIFIVEN
jgi:uncharacterized repeat protein (TIGR02543 family)